MNEAGTKGKIFYVEDDKFLSDLLLAKLVSSGFIVEYYSNGEDAIAKLPATDAKLFLIDLLLPGVDGFEIITQVKAMPAHQNKPIVIFSNYGDQSNIDKGFSLGADKYLVKSSFVPEEIVSEINGMMNQVPQAATVAA